MNILRANHPFMQLEAIWPNRVGVSWLQDTRGPRLGWILAETGVCVMPAMACIYWGQPSLGAACFFPVLLVLLIRHLLKRDRYRIVILVISCTPALAILRQFFLYNSMILSLGLGLVLWALTAPSECLQLWHLLVFRCMLVFGVAYWLASVACIGDYNPNLRILELIFAAANLFLLSQRRRYLGAALVGYCLSVFSVGIAFLPYGDRLGMARIGEGSDAIRLGNPITFGIPIALVFLLSISDRGKWLLLEKHSVVRLTLTLTAGSFLLLSTSRGSIAIVLTNIVVVALFGGRERRSLLTFAGLMTLVTVVLLSTERGEFISAWFERTVSSERTLSQQSSGRSDQWMIFPRALQDSPIWGFGPGSGKETYAKYSLLDERVTLGPGEKIEWHSLYLHLGVETGIVGLTILLLMLTSLLLRAVGWYRHTRDTTPLIGIIGFLVIAGSVSGMDAPSGLFLGLAFISCRSLPDAHYPLGTPYIRLSRAARLAQRASLRPTVTSR